VPQTFWLARQVKSCCFALNKIAGTSGKEFNGVVNLVASQNGGSSGKDANACRLIVCLLVRLSLAGLILWFVVSIVVLMVLGHFMMVAGWFTK
jgi:hypothetical protein